VDSSTAGVGSSHPNPFRDQSTFSVSLDAAQAVDVAVFDVLGRHVVTIHHGVLPQGTSTLAWNGRRADGSRAPGGIYFYRLTLQDRVIHRQVVLLGTP
jgi:flagellar hook assembly protein FlgD